MHILWFPVLCFYGFLCTKVCFVSMCVSHAFSLPLSLQLVCSIPSLFICYYLVLFYFVIIFHVYFYSNEKEKERVWIWVSEKLERN